MTITSSSLPAPRRVLIGASAHAELAALLRARRPDLEVRGKPYMEITANDLAWADTYMGFKRPPLPTMGNVRWVHCTGAGVDSWLYPTELSRDILLTRTSESFGVYIAEWALARAFAVRQEIVALADAQRRREWSPREIGYLRGSRAVIVGTGDVGTHIARLFSAVGATVHGVSRTGRGDASLFATVSRVSELPRLVGDADWLILTLPLTTETRGLIGRAVLRECRGAVLMNAGRGAVVDENVIPEAIERGWLSRAILDVFETEPLPQGSPLWDNPRVMISPHISGLTTPEGAVTGLIQCLDEIEHGRIPTRTVDRDRGY